MGAWWREQLRRRPFWMNVLMFVCAYLAFIYVPWDFLFKPVALDEEVWFGFVLRGWAAKLTEPLHWLIYAAGAYGFWRMSPWMWPWASVYVAQLTVATLVWNVVYVGGIRGWSFGILSAAACGGLALALWRARDSFRAPPRSLRERYGEWALVTGASSGIGAEFARALARNGLSCVVTARREDRLLELADELQRNHGVAARVVAVDLSQPGGVDELVHRIEDLEITFVVNNAGYGYAGTFAKQDSTRLRAMIELNCVAPVVLTRAVLPKMQARGRGAVIVVGSVAGAQPVPYNGVYAATKAFDRFFGESLWAELQGTGIDVLVLEPGPTETEFQIVAGEVAHAGEPPQKVVQVALEALGRQPSVISGWFNWVQASSTRLAPRPLLALIAARVMRQWVPAEMR